MKLTRLLPGLVAAAFLTACATTERAPAIPAVRPASTVASALSDADAAVMGGQSDKAYTILKDAATAFPTDKTPWLRMAQMRFDSGNYGEAIVNALEATGRDPDDTLANSILAVSGLRVASKAMADLIQKKNLSGSVRAEAQELAKLLRANVGEDVIVPATGRTVQRPKDPPKRLPFRPAAGSGSNNSNNSNSNSDPFGALKH
jgi:predicted Zn-dependent protease